MGDLIEINPALQKIDPTPDSKTTCVDEALWVYMNRATKLNTEADTLGKTIEGQRDNQRFINEIISELNSCTDEKDNSLDLLDLMDRPKFRELLEKSEQLGITLPAALQKKVDKLNQAHQTGVQLKEKDHLKLDSFQRERLLENLHLAFDNWEKDNKVNIQKMEIFLKQLDRLLLLAKEAQKAENNVSRATNAGMKGG